MDHRNSNVGRDDALPSVETTQKFLSLCEQYGSHEAAVAAVARRRRSGVAGLPLSDDWPAWNAADMRSAVEYPDAAGAEVTEFGGGLTPPRFVSTTV